MELATFRKYGVEVTFQDNSEELKEMLAEAIKEGLEECGKVAKRYAQAELRKPKAHKNGEIRPNIITIANIIKVSKNNIFEILRLFIPSTLYNPNSPALLPIKKELV